jgi:two-component system, chemotaxis family, CheB/CheR fusion protein
MPEPQTPHISAQSDLPVVGVGASAGGLDALTKLISALPADGGMAYILVQHLDPNHESLMAELLAKHTKMPVLQAGDNAILLANHIYVIPAGSYLSVHNGALHLSEPTAPHGARMPVDFLFESMAADCGDRAIAIILSGTGADGTHGIKAIKAKGGFVIVQDSAEAQFDGMPQSAVASGAANAVLKAEQIPAALTAYIRSLGVSALPHSRPKSNDVLPEIIAYLRKHTTHDFTLYKMGTLQRRIERRMALASIPASNIAHYLATLKQDKAELNLLASDLLINVTQFFRDPKVFELLAKTIVPDIVREHPEDRPLRIWIAGCSTGEETYSLAMVFEDAIAAANRTIKLCVFASDVDPDAIATAREGSYPESISADVSPERLTRYFVKRDHGYSIIPEMRAKIVFTVQDVLSDPPFSKLDFVSCRNLLIYLGPEAQAKAIALFHFALRPGGILVLGTSETIGHAEAQFETISKSERIYRHVGKNRPGTAVFSTSSGGARIAPRPLHGQAIAREPALAELCKRLVLESYAPAAVLINRRYECLYSMGPTDRYLRVAPGYPTHDLLAMAAPALRAKLRAAIEKVSRTSLHIVSSGGRTKQDGQAVAFEIDVRSVMHDGEELLLVGFMDRPSIPQISPHAGAGDDVSRVADLEHELNIARTELSAALHDIEVSGEEHRAVNEEALSVNEEYQSANEELLTSKEELQSLNEELTALNGQLQETLERQRTTSNDLQNVLYSTDVATLFLDTDLKIRFFTPAIKALFNLIPADIGRPLSDLQALATDPNLKNDVQSVLDTRTFKDCEIEAPNNIWFMRRIMPYLTDNDRVEGVVITFSDITERKTVRKALEIAKREAERANIAKSRFLASASHDLRQPLQSLALLQGLLAKIVEGERAHTLIGRLDNTLATMSAMLNTMLDINQIEAGVVRAERVDFVVGDLIERVRSEFVEQALAKKLELRAVRCDRVIHSDPAKIEQMLRNLISNALKYTKRGKILLGCRQHGDILKIEVWDTGVGIETAELEAIFEEYHQIDNAARERSLGLGLGLSIVRRLGDLLGHKVGVRSLPSRGSVFSIEVVVAKAAKKIAKPKPEIARPNVALPSSHLTGTILIVDDDPDVRELLDEFLVAEGHCVITAYDGKSALAMIAEKSLEPDLVVADYNLPAGMNGLQLRAKVHELLGRAVPVIILTGDISTTTLRAVADQGAVQLNKPVKLDALTNAIQRLLQLPAGTGKAAATIYIVDDDSAVREALCELLQADGRSVESFGDCESFLAAYRPQAQACLLIDAYLPGIHGIDLLKHLKNAGYHLPAIMITGNSAVPLAVDAMKVGAIDFIEKPVGAAALLASIDRALEVSRDATKLLEWHHDAAVKINSLTARQRQVMDLVLAGHPSKNIAADLHISQRSVEAHRAAIMKKTGAKSLPALARLALAAAGPRLDT